MCVCTCEAWFVYVCIISSEESEETCLCDIQRICPLANENSEKELYFLAKYMNRGFASFHDPSDSYIRGERDHPQPVYLMPINPSSRMDTDPFTVRTLPFSRKRWKWIVDRWQQPWSLNLDLILVTIAKHRESWQRNKQGSLNPTDTT